MKIAVYQGRSPAGDVAQAFEIVETMVSTVSCAGVRMIVFPELFLPGYNQPELHKTMAQSVPAPWDEQLSNIAKKHSCGLTIGWAERDGESIFNSVSCFDERGEKVVHYRKIQLFGPVEKSTFEFGNTYQTFLALRRFKWI